MSSKITLHQKSAVILASVDAFELRERMGWSPKQLKKAAMDASVHTGIKSGTFEIAVYKLCNLIFEEITNIKIPGVHKDCASWLRDAAVQLVQEGSVK